MQVQLTTCPVTCPLYTFGEHKAKHQNWKTRKAIDTQKKKYHTHIFHTFSPGTYIFTDRKITSWLIRKDKINNLIQWLDRQWAANKERKQRDECCWLASEETKLIQKLASVQHEQQWTRNFAIGDQVVIKNPNLSWVGGILNSADWQGVITSVTDYRIYFCGDSGYTMHRIRWHICYATTEDECQ